MCGGDLEDMGNVWEVEFEVGWMGAGAFTDIKVLFCDLWFSFLFQTLIWV